MSVASSTSGGSSKVPGTATGGDGYGLMEGPLDSDPTEQKKHFILAEIDTHLEHLLHEEVK
jgi:hypothetical protein